MTVLKESSFNKRQNDKSDCPFWINIKAWLFLILSEESQREKADKLPQSSSFFPTNSLQSTIPLPKKTTQQQHVAELYILVGAI